MDDKPTGILGITEYRMGKPKTVKEGQVESKRPRKKYEPLELSGKLKQAEDVEEKRVIVAWEMGDLFYIFGQTRRAWKPWLSYEDNMNEADWRN